MFDADRPIVSHEQDRLGRTTFAKYLARCILDHKTPESLVIGLYGGWGVGKTSLINLALEELRFAASNMFDDEKPVILNFSPWSYSGQNQLIYSFFRRLTSEIRQADYFENSEKIVHLLELYVSFFTHKPVPKSLRPKHNFLTRIFQRKLIASETFAWESGRDLTQVKAELNTLMQNQKHKLIIIIDNIARLDDAEIKQIFQIVKSMGDFTNTIYLLSLDKTHIIKALNKILGYDGAEYLEKIIQLPFEIPSITQQDLEIIFIDRLQKIFSIVPEEAWNKDYWADLYYSTLKYYFENVRDITHYINALNFGYAHVIEVVNPVDFFAITAIEIFSPKVYCGIRDNKDLFTDLMDNVYQPDAKKIAEDKFRCDEILNRVEKISRDKLLQLLIHLFPRLRTIYEPDTPFYHSEALARKNMRICAPDVFDIYFRLSMPSGTISELEMNAILAITNDEEGFGLALLRLNQDEKITKFLDLLDSKEVFKIAKENIGKVISGLMDGGDLFPEGEDTSVSFNTAMRLHRIFHQLLQRIDGQEKRFEIFAEAIKKAVNSIYIITHELSEQGKEHIETEDTFIPLEHRDFNPDQLHELRKLAVDKIKRWVNIGRLHEHPKFLQILYAWKNWGNENECKNYVEKITEDDKGLMAFLGAALKIPIDEALNKLEPNPHWKDYLANIDEFIPAKNLEHHAKKMFEDLEFEKLRDREQLAILIFLDLIGAETLKVIPKTTY